MEPMKNLKGMKMQMRKTKPATVRKMKRKTRKSKRK
jgi:hypothetical protein